jgi:hypothetical protein
VLALAGDTHIYSQIDWPSNIEFVRMLGVEGVTYNY